MASLHVLITGGSAGIGGAAAHAFSREGHRLVLCGRREAPLRAIAVPLQALAIVADVTSPSDRVRLVEAARAYFGGPPDVVVHAAGSFALRPVAGDDPDLLQRLLSVNLIAPYHLAALTLPEMIRRGAGHQIFLGSVAGRQVFPGNGAYSASKFGLRGVHGVLDAELRGTGVVATLIEPAATDTSIWDDVPREEHPGLPAPAAMLRPEEVASFIVFCATRPRGVAPGLVTLRAER